MVYYNQMKQSDNADNAQFFLTNPNELNETLCRLKQAVTVHPIGVPKCCKVLQVLHLGRGLASVTQKYS